MSENKTGKYIKYALGEILLVMIGILLALQVNNWNEERKEKEKELNVLLDISETLNENLLTLEYAIEHLKTSNNSSHIVLRLLNDSIALSDTLDVHFDRAKWDSPRLLEGLSDAGYISLTNIGFDFINNNDLRKLVIRHFSKDYQELISSFNWRKELYANYDEYIRRNFIDFGGPRAFPLNPDIVLKDNYYRSIISTIYDHRKTRLILTQEFHDKTLSLLQTINEEIKLME